MTVRPFYLMKRIYNLPMINLVYLTHVAMAVQLEHAVTLFYATGNASKYASPLL